MFESQLPQQNPLDPSLKSSFNNSEFNPEFHNEIFSSLRNKGEFSLPKIEINNLIDSSSFNDYENLLYNFWQPSTIEANATTSPISLTGNTKDLPLVYPVEINQDALLIARNHSYSSEISLNSNTISGVLQQDVYLTLQKFVQSPNFEQMIQSIFGTNVNPEKINIITEQWQAGDFSKLPKIEVREQSVFPTNTLGAFAGATDKIYLSQGLLNSGNTAIIGDTILEEIGHWLDKQFNFVDTPGDEGQMFTAVVRGQKLSPVKIAEIRAEDDSTMIFVDGQFLKVEQSSIVLPTINITAKDANAGETLAGQTANSGQFTLTRIGNITSSLQVNYTITGTATNSTDYNKLTNSVTFAAGSTTALINITPIDDGQFEGNETVVLTLATSTNYNLGTAKNATVNIADNDKPIITISATDINAGETLAGQTANPGQFTLTRTGNNTSALTVNYIVAGTATNSADYNKLTNAVTFAAGSSTALINITPIDDGQFEGNETVVLTLATSTNYNLGTAKNATVNIADNDKPIITISATDINAGETLVGKPTNPGQFTLTRTGNVVSALTVNYTIAGTAINSTDYSNLSGNATFMAGAATTLVTVIPKDDSIFERNESVILTLAAGNAYTLGNAQTATVTLTDKNSPNNSNQSPILIGIPNNFVMGKSNYDSYMSGSDYYVDPQRVIAKFDSDIQGVNILGWKPFESFSLERILKDTFKTLVASGTWFKNGDPSVTLPFYQDFLSGRGGETVLYANNRLVQEAKNDPNLNFNNKITQAKNLISSKINQQFNQGFIDGNIMIRDIQNKIDIPHISFENGNLFIIIHGIQKAEISMNNFIISLNNNGNGGTWSGNLRYTLYDDFGFSLDSDVGQTGLNIIRLMNQTVDSIKSLDVSKIKNNIEDLGKEIAKASVLDLGYVLQKYGSANAYGIKMYVEEQISGNFGVS
ncbi:hypothetical protein LC613_11475 [Nostoc sphaeroides CHAB 2801]|uniref:Calx-beta domain-containing protein n=1 Tax=Nostoc sphaeroides TaxID=446679 RepID=UPI000E53F097|nr:Calx-beta domain-containing protein [Nostoc sphaeroides]MCC5628684.1 hypothetical protein [Nostoc sphaeroides CHAB 2801]